MALLQLSEPGQSSAPHQHRLAAGIDLGTTNSVVAVKKVNTEVLKNAEGEYITPSCVMVKKRLEMSAQQNAVVQINPAVTVALLLMSMTVKIWTAVMVRGRQRRHRSQIMMPMIIMMSGSEPCTMYKIGTF